MLTSSDPADELTQVTLFDRRRRLANYSDSRLTVVVGLELLRLQA